MLTFSLWFQCSAGGGGGFLWDPADLGKAVEAVLIMFRVSLDEYLGFEEGLPEGLPVIRGSC